MVYFKYKDKDAFGRSIAEIMQNIHDKFCLGDKSMNLETLFASNLQDKMNAVGGFNGITVFPDKDLDNIDENDMNAKLQNEMKIFNRKVNVKK